MYGDFTFIKAVSEFKWQFDHLCKDFTVLKTIGEVANSKRPLLIIPKVQLRLRVTRSSATALACYPQKLAKLFVGNNFVKILVTAQTQLRSYSEQQRAFGNSNICNCTIFEAILPFFRRVYQF